MIGENAMKDSELIQKMHSGNKEAVSIIVERYYADMYGWSRHSERSIYQYN